jgi:asparagine synthetase B (glutamine-hydrolysing)
VTAVAQDEREASRFRLTPLEIAGGLPLGIDSEHADLPDAQGLSPLTAFEAVVRPALERPPCVVSFSGGRDSSAVLAVAVRLARREGLPPPVAVTLRFLEAPGTGELRWQERVAAHLGLEDWVRLEVGEEVDYVGPVARRLLVRHGVIHPGVTPLFWLQLELARGGSLLTGFGGDAVSGGWLPRHSAEVLAGRAGPRLRDVPTLAYALAPSPLRRAVMRRRLTRQAWLRPPAFRAFVAARGAEFGGRPVRWDRFLAWEARLRRGRALEWALSRLARDVHARVAHPFHDRRFVAALAHLGGARGLGDRSAVMRALFSGDLPDDVLSRPDKANFALAYFRRHTRAFARRWDGRGLDPELVDAEALRQAWLALIVDPRSALALQAAWLDSAERGLEELPADVV